MNNITVDNVGTINLKEKVMVSDPCYGLNTWCQGVLENVLPGEYKCFVERSDEGEWGNRVSAITAIHSDYEYRIDGYNPESFTVGVDSGQAGIYDYEYYSKFHGDTDETSHCDDEWYDRVYKLTIVTEKNPNYKPFDDSKYDKMNIQSLIRMWEDQDRWRKSLEGHEYIQEFYGGCIDNLGFVSSTGYGDGAYTCWTARNEEGKIVAICVEYITEDEDDE